MKKTKSQNKCEVNQRINSRDINRRVNPRFKSWVQEAVQGVAQEIVVATGNMMAMPRNIILKLKIVGDKKNEK